MKNQESTTKEVFDTLDQSSNKAVSFIESKSKPLANGFFIIVLLFAGVYFYNKYYSEPQSEKAANELFFPMDYFNKKQYEIALNGDGQYFGFIDLADQYSGTNIANIALFYAGISYASLEKLGDAISTLKKVSSDDVDLMASTYSKIADYEAENDNYTSSLTYYEKALGLSKNIHARSILLYKAASTSMLVKDNKKALKYFSAYVEEFPNNPLIEDAKKLKEQLEWAAKA